MQLYKPASLILLLSTLTIGLAQCTSSEIGESKDVSQDKIYQSYDINYKESEPSASVTCQYRFAGKDGTTLILSNPSSVSLDGTSLQVDSSAGRGAYYEGNKPGADFFGKHEVVFTDINNKKFVNDFNFERFRLIDIPSIVNKNQPLKIGFETTPLKAGDQIVLSSTNTDSTFSVTYSNTDSGKYIIIPAKELQRQKGTELGLVADLYREIPLQQQTVEGGKISVRHTLKPLKIKLK